MSKIPGDSNSKRTGEGGGGGSSYLPGVKKVVLATSFSETRDPGNEVVVLLPLRVFSLKTSTTGAVGRAVGRAVAVLFSALSPKKVSVSQCVALELVPRAGAYY